MKHTNKKAWLSLLLVLVMVWSALPLGLLSANAATAVTPDTGWYSNAAVLEIHDAADLWAFATKLNGGTTFAGQTVKLMADITVNEGWNAFAATVTQPTSVWPLVTVNCKFAGTFDGQGHTVSGLYAKMTAAGSYGFFGNVATGTTATVKNLVIENSYLGAVTGKTGTIFGEICSESSVAITDPDYVNATHGYIDGVSITANVYSEGAGNNGSNNGVGGFVGINRADLTIKNSAFHGDVRSDWRGVAAFLGSSYPTQGNIDHDKDSSTAAVSSSLYVTHTVIENCMTTGYCGQYSASSYGHNGALVGYSNSSTDRFVFRNILLAGTVAGASPTGYVFGGTHCTANSYRTQGAVVDYQTITFENVHYIKTSGELNAFGKTTTGQQITGLAASHRKGDLTKLITKNLKQSVTLKNDLALNVYATILDKNATVTINGKPVEGAFVDGVTQRFTLDGILPQQMNDEFTVRISQTVAGETVVVEKTTSIRQYCRLFWDREETTDQEKNLIADLLRYGAQAQTYTGYQTDTLATAGMNLTGYGSSVTASQIPTCYALSTSTASGYALLGASLVLDNSIQLCLKLQTPSPANTTLSVTVNGRTTTYRASDFSSMGGKAYSVLFNNVHAYEMKAPITVKLMSGGNTVQTLTYSVADYCKSLLNANASGNEKLLRDQAVVQKMYAYGLSAEQYNDEHRLLITKDTVVVYDDADENAKALAKSFAQSVKDKTGLTLSVVADTVAKKGREIVIGVANGRAKSSTELNQLTALNQNGYRISIVENDIYVVSGSKFLLEYATKELLGDIRTHGGNTWGIELDYLALVDAPVYATTGKTQTYYADEYNYTWTVTDTNATEYNSYINTLKTKGFSEYTTHKIGDSIFGTYVKDDTVVYATWHANSKNARITYGPLRFLPGTEQVTASATGVRAIPSIIQNARATTYAGAPGMSYVLQLVDGSFILIDGGNADQDIKTKTKNEDGTWTTNPSVRSQDAKNLYDLLVELSPDEKPVIAMWYVSHAHGDHMNLTNRFLQTYHADVDLKMVAYNFPDFVDSVTITNDSNGTGMKNIADTFKKNVSYYYPEAEHWILHTGQKLYLPGCEVEVYYTPEDYYGTNTTTTETFPWGNHTSSTIRITLGETSFLVLGDSEKTLCQQMATNYKSANKSDILQVSHHGANGGDKTLYQYVNPGTVFWPMDEFRYENDARCLGLNGETKTDDASFAEYQAVKKTLGMTFPNTSYDFNYWIRNNGDRKHYAVSATEHTRIFCSFPNDFVIVTPSMPL